MIQNIKTEEVLSVKPRGKLKTLTQLKREFEYQEKIENKTPVYNLYYLLAKSISFRN